MNAVAEVSPVDPAGQAVDCADPQTWAAPKEWAEAAVADCLTRLRRVHLRVTGECMAPVLRAGETVFLAHADDVPPRWGDVVLVRHRAGLKLHRLVVPFPAALRRTKGDRSLLMDGRLCEGDILATVIGSERLARRPRSVRRALLSLVRGLLARMSRQ